MCAPGTLLSFLLGPRSCTLDTLHPNHLPMFPHEIPTRVTLFPNPEYCFHIYLTPKSICGSLNENNPHRLMYLSSWSRVGRTVWPCQQMCITKGLALRFQKYMPLSASHLCLRLLGKMCTLSHCSSAMLAYLLPCSPPWLSRTLIVGNYEPQIKHFLL